MSLNRRKVLQSIIALSSAAITPAHAKSRLLGSQSISHTFLFVHGAFHGGWCWDDVAGRLRSEGHKVFTPTLTGLNPMTTGNLENIRLETHIQDLETLIQDEDLNTIILVSHSYGGIVATGVADRHRTRIQHLIYLDAYVPVDGGSFIDARLNRTEAEMVLDKGLALNAKEGRIYPFPPEVFGVMPSHPKYQFVKDNVTAHPARTWLDPVRLRNGGIAGIPKTYIQCTNPKLGGGLFDPYAEMARTTDGWTYQDIATGHDAMITAPEELSRLLLQSAKMKTIQ